MKHIKKLDAAKAKSNEKVKKLLNLSARSNLKLQHCPITTGPIGTH